VYKDLTKEKLLQYNILVEINALKFTQDDANVLNSLHSIIENTEVGDYEYGNLIFRIRSKNAINSTEMSNPVFDNKLLNIV